MLKANRNLLGASKGQHHVTFKVDDVPWDQALDLLARMNGVDWARTGGVMHVSFRKPVATR
jgi:type II secretory pathway component HofQ